MSDPFAVAKRSAARAAADLVTSGMRVGFGTGSTFVHVLDRLAERVDGEGLEVVGVPTSESTAERARALGLALTTFEEVDALDMAIDGADEIDRDKHMIKGGGGALLREKIVAGAAREMVVIVGENKVVERLGETFRLPVEVLPFGWRVTARRIAVLGCKPERRAEAEADSPFRTDNGNYVLDCGFAPIDDPAMLERALDAIPGIVETGLFVGMAGRVLVGDQNGGVRLID